MTTALPVKHQTTGWPHLRACGATCIRRQLSVPSQLTEPQSANTAPAPASCGFARADTSPHGFAAGEPSVRQPHCRGQAPNEACDMAKASGQHPTVVMIALIAPGSTLRRRAREGARSHAVGVSQAAGSESQLRVGRSALSRRWAVVEGLFPGQKATRRGSATDLHAAA